jgi:hypothetical protein
MENWVMVALSVVSGRLGLRVAGIIQSSSDGGGDDPADSPTGSLRQGVQVADLFRRQ